jgi:phosphatidylinositol alpha-mannosyltransferase
VLKSIPLSLRSRINFLGRLSESEKADFLKSVTVYVAPNTGGESFGIILTEAMAAGATIVASDIPAFAEVLQSGEYGSLFISENSQSLATVIDGLLKNQEKRRELSQSGTEGADKYDWKSVAAQISDVYEMALASGPGVTLASENRPWKRFRSNE